MLLCAACAALFPAPASSPAHHATPAQSKIAITSIILLVDMPLLPTYITRQPPDTGSSKTPVFPNSCFPKEHKTVFVEGQGSRNDGGWAAIEAGGEQGERGRSRMSDLPVGVLHPNLRSEIPLTR